MLEPRSLAADLGTDLSSKRPSARQTWPGTLVTAVCSFLALRSLALALTLSTPVPIADQWEFIPDLMRLKEGRLSLWDLFDQHNEHRIFTARLSFLIDAHFFHLGNASVVMTNYALLALLAAGFTGLATRGRPRAVAVPAFACTLAVAWSVGNWLNLGWAFQIQWAYVHLFSAATLVCFATSALRGGAARWALLSAACLCDALAAFSMSSGLMTLVPVVALAVWLRADSRLVGLFCLWHAIVVLLFLWGYVPPPHELVLSPYRILRYMAPYLGTLLPGTKRGAVLLGDLGLLAGLAAMSAATWISVVRRRRIDPPLAVLLGVALFVLAEGVATAFGRAGLPDPTSFALRYGTPSDVFWIALALCAWRMSRRLGAVALTNALVAAALCGAVLTNASASSVRSWREWSASADAAGFGLVDQVWTGPSALQFYPRPALIQDRIAFLNDRRLGPFAEQEGRFRAPLNAMSGQDLSKLQRCAGLNDPPERDEDGHLHVQGWAVSLGDKRAPAWLLAYGEQGRVVGYAPVRRPRVVPFAAAGRAVVPSYDAWLRLAETEAPETIKLVLVFPGGTAEPCLASPLEVDEAR